MENEKKFKLIDGTFTVEEADKVLSALLNYKIDYHTREDFSNHIRFNKNIEHSKKRIQELTETKLAIKKLVNESKTDHLNFIISSTISIRIER